MRLFTLTVLALAIGLSCLTGPSVTANRASNDFSAVPLPELGSRTYKGFEGGLYTGGKNSTPSAHAVEGRKIVSEIQPLDSNGHPDPHGKIVLTSIGMSNAADEFGLFLRQARMNAAVSRNVVILNGGFGGITTCDWVAPFGAPPCSQHTENQFDRVRDRIFEPAGVTERQVQAVWIKEANGGPGVHGCGPNRFQPCRPLCDPSDSGCRNEPESTEALRFEAQLGQILRAAKVRWPNLKLAFISSRIYAGYSRGPVSPEPFAYEYGFSVKWLIEAQIRQTQSHKADLVAGDLDFAKGVVPWVDWGPYLWADGANARPDGIAWCNGQEQAPCNGEMDFQQDGMHPNVKGQLKVASLLMNFFLTSPFTETWFSASSHNK